MNEEEHYNDFECSHYKLKGEGSFFLLGYSTPGFKDIMANGGAEIMEKKYAGFLGGSIPSIPGCDLTLGVDRSTLPKKISITSL